MNQVDSSKSYSARSIQVLSGLEAVRKNPSMYIGSVGQDGLNHLVYEVVYNSVDEAIAGFCTEIEVYLTAEGSCIVVDNGRGIPVDIHEEEGISALEVVFTKLHAGGKFDNSIYQNVAGLHGVGVSCVNALSSKLKVDVWKPNGRHAVQEFFDGEPLSPVKLESVSGERSGTRVEFVPNLENFDKGVRFDGEALIVRFRELAFLHPGITISFKDESSEKPYQTKFQFDTGIQGYVEFLSKDQRCLVKSPIYLQSKSGEIDLEVAAQWSVDSGEHINSYVNSVHTIHGGSHVSGVKAGLTRALNQYIREVRDGGNDSRISIYEVVEGLLAVISVKLTRPTFEGQTKTRLTNVEVTDKVSSIVCREFLSFLRAESKSASVIVERILDSKRARIAARRASDRVYLKNLEFDLFTEEVYKKQFGERSKTWHDSAVWITDEELLSEHVEHLKVPTDAKVLDVCCGSGVVGGSFKGKVGHITGLDLTPEMVALAKERLDTVVQGNVYDIPFEDNSYDLVVTREVLHLLPQPEKPVSEIYRVLKPGGQFIVGQILPYGPDDGPWMYRVFKKKQPLIYNMFQEDDFRNMLLGAGFIDLKMTENRTWESIDVWIDSYETTSIARHEIRDLFANTPEEARAVHPYEILPSGEIRDLWRWCVFSVRKPL